MHSKFIRTKTTIGSEKKLDMLYGTLNFESLEEIENIDDIFQNDITTGKARFDLKNALSLPKAERDTLIMITQWMAKVLNYKKPGEWIEFLIKKISKFMKVQRWYIMKFDIGENKLRHVSDTSWIDLPIQTESDAESDVKLNSTFKSQRFGRRKIQKVNTNSQVYFLLTLEKQCVQEVNWLTKDRVFR